VTMPNKFQGQNMMIGQGSFERPVQIRKAFNHLYRGCYGYIIIYWLVALMVQWTWLREILIS